MKIRASVIDGLSAFALIAVPVSHATAAEDPAVLMGEYLSLVSASETLRSKACSGFGGNWTPTYASSEQWVLRLLSDKDRNDYRAARSSMASEAQEAAAEFVKMHEKARRHMANSDQACAYTLGFVHGLAMPALKQLYALEVKKFGRVTMQHK
jgi:hypothetical protein